MSEQSSEQGSEPVALSSVSARHQAALWRELHLDNPPEVFFPAWLQLQCLWLPEIRSAVLVARDPDTGSFRPWACHPDPVPDERLAGIAELAMSAREGQQLGTDGDRLLAYPVLLADELKAVVAVRMSAGTTEEHSINLLQWGSAWLRGWFAEEDRADNAAVNESLIRLLDLLAVVLEREGFKPAALALVTELAGAIGVDRVSLGFGDGSRTRVSAISGSTTVIEEMQTVAALRDVMDHAMAATDIVVLATGADDSDPSLVSLAELGGCPAVVGIPLFCEGRVCGALVVEASAPLEGQTLELIKSVALATGPMLELKRRAALPLHRNLVRKAGDVFRGLVGEGNSGPKIAGLVVLLILLALVFVEVDQRITADSVLEGAIQRTISSPLDGYIKEAPSRAGDTVVAGELLAALDESDLRLSRLQVATERSQLLRQAQQATANRERATAQVIAAQIEQTDAKLNLLDEQINRATITAPFDGVLIEGDLSQSLGAAVARGEVLFVLAPLSGYRVVLEVDEHDVRFISDGQSGSLVLAAQPDVSYGIEVAKVTPVATVREGLNTFRVEAVLIEPRPGLRPGMRGVGKIDVGRGALGWVWGRRLIEWLRLQLWTWLP